MATVATEQYGVFSPQNTSNLEDELDFNVTDTSTMEVVTQTTQNTDEWFMGFNNFYLAVVGSALIFAAMCLLVLCNIVCYITWKKHRVWRKRQKQLRYALDEIRPGLDDSVMLANLSPDTRMKQKQTDVNVYHSDTDGKQIPSPQSSRKADTIFEDTDDSEPVFFIHTSSSSNSTSGSSSRTSSKRNYKRKLPSAPVISETSETCVDIEPNPYRVLDTSRSDSLIESVKQREREAQLERGNKPRSLKLRHLSSSSSECLSPTIPTYKEQIIARRKCVSLSHGVIPPWHRKGFDPNDDPAYAVVNLVGHMRPSKSFTHNRPHSAFEPRPSHQRKSTRSLHDPPIRIKSSKRPSSVNYDINDHRQPAPIPAPRKPARLPSPMSDGASHYDNFRSATAAGVTLIPDIDNKLRISEENLYPSSSDDDDFSTARRTKKVDWDIGSSYALNHSHSEPDLDRLHTPYFFPDQPLPITPMSPPTELFDYTERRLSGESSERRHPFVQRQRSFSDSITREPHCALDDIGETFTGIEPLSSSSSETRLDFLPETPPQLQRFDYLQKSPPLRKKVLLRQKKLADNAKGAARPISEPVPRADFARVYPRLSYPQSDEESLTAFPPYKP